MKRMIVLAALFIIIVPGFAQRRDVQFGIKAGVNLANFNDNVSTSGSRTGFHGGFLAHLHLSPNWALQPEIVYSTQGAKMPGGHYEIDYINLPILVQYMFRSGFRIESGIQLGLLTSAKFEENDGDESNFRGDFNSSDISLPIGIGYVTPTGLGFDVRYNLGLTDINKGNSEVMNRVWQLGMFYQFRR